MYWKVAGISPTSPVESILDKDVYTLEELLYEDEIIQECKAANTRLVGFLRAKPQVQQMLRYVIEEPPEGADNDRAFKFPFIACEVITCEIDVIFKTLVEDEELMNMLFSFLDPDHVHGTLLAGYFSKVVICLLIRKTVAVMRYLQGHQEILKKLVDLIGITSIMEVLVRLVGADEHIYAFHADSLQWLAETDLLDLLVDKLSPQYSSEVHASAAETLSAVTRIAPSALSTKLATPRFAARLFHHVLEDPECKSTLNYALSVCCGLLDPKRAATIAAAGAARGQHIPEPLPTANPETVEGMLPRLGKKSGPESPDQLLGIRDESLICAYELCGDLLKLLDVSVDKKMLPTTYGSLSPPLGIHRLKVVEFIAVLLRTNSEVARLELVRHKAIETVLDLFFNYCFNNMLHHHVESIINSCIESSSQVLVDHLFEDCNFLDQLLAADEFPFVTAGHTEPKLLPGKRPLRIGNMGHLTRIANKLNESTSPLVQAHLQVNAKWAAWCTATLASRNNVENVYKWSCGRPTAIQDRPADSDDDDFRDRDYDISTMAQNLTREVYCTTDMFDNEDIDEVSGAGEGENDMFFDDEQEVVIASFHVGDNDRIFGNNPGWSLTPYFCTPRGEDNSASSPNSSGGSSSDDEVVLGEDDELVDTATSSGHYDMFGDGFDAHFDDHESGLGHHREANSHSVKELSSDLQKVGLSDSLSLFQLEDRNPDQFSTKSADAVGTSGRDSFGENNPFDNPFDSSFGGSMEPVEGSNSDLLERVVVSDESAESGGHEIVADTVPIPCLENHKDDAPQGPEVVETLFGNPVKLLGVEPAGTAKAMEKALKEGIVGEAGPILPHEETGLDKDAESRTKDGIGNADYNDVNYWRSDYDQSVAKDEQL